MVRHIRAIGESVAADPIWVDPLVALAAVGVASAARAFVDAAGQSHGNERAIAAFREVDESVEGGL